MDGLPTKDHVSVPADPGSAAPLSHNKIWRDVEEGFTQPLTQTCSWGQRASLSSTLVLTKDAVESSLTRWFLLLGVSMLMLFR